MNVLAFDTCFAACSAAVRWQPPPRAAAPEGGLRAVARCEPMMAGHAERLMPMIAEVMREAGCRFADLDALAVTEGPGTFTGLRIGVAAARGLALATGLPVRVATSLHVMAAGAVRRLGGLDAGHDLAVCADARNGHVFFQLFSPLAEPAGPAMLALPQDVASSLRSRPLVCVGPGADAVADAVRRSGQPASADLPGLLPDAADLAALAPLLPVRQPPVPLYLRAPDARPQLDRALPRTP